MAIETQESPNPQTPPVAVKVGVAKKPKKNRKVLIVVLVTLFLAGMLCASLYMLQQSQKETAVKNSQTVFSKFISNLADGDIDTAYSLTSPNYQKEEIIENFREFFKNSSVQEAVKGEHKITSTTTSNGLNAYPVIVKSEFTLLGGKINVTATVVKVDGKSLIDHIDFK